MNRDERAAITRKLLLLGNQLMQVAGEVGQSGHDESPFAWRETGEAPQDSNLWLLMAKDYYHERRRRTEFFTAGLFGEPAWDILLDLYIAAKENRRVPTTSACIGADVPPTTALRWLQALEDEGLIEREADKLDQRRTWVHLSAKGYLKMTDYFARMRSALLRDDILRRSVDRRRAGERAPPEDFGRLDDPPRE